MSHVTIAHRLLVVAGWIAASSAYADAKIEAQVRSFEAQPAPRASQVFIIGESDIRDWHKVQEQLAPVAVVARGLEGASVQTLRLYLDRLALDYQPSAVVIAAGQNEAELGAPAAGLMRAHRSIVATVRERAPDASVYLLGLKPTPANWASWHQIQHVNGLLRTHCQASRQCQYIDVSEVLMDDSGPKEAYFQEDGEHLSAAGYEALAGAIRPILLETLDKIPRAPTALTVQ